MASNTSIADRIADWVAGFEFEQASPGAIEAAKRCLIDICGVAIAGSRTPATRIAAGVANRTYAAGQSRVLGSARQIAAPGAAFVNATAAHALDYDDTCFVGIVHPSAIIMPALAAVSDELNISGAEFATAFIAGFEVQSAAAAVLGNNLYEKGWFTTSVLGVLGASAAVARARRLTGDDMRQVLRLAAVQGAGVRAVQGTLAKPLLAGRASECAVSTVDMIVDGATAPADAFESPKGFVHAYNDGKADTAVLDEMGRRFVIEAPGVAFKLYPVCSSAQAAAEITAIIMREAAIEPNQVARIDCEATPLVMNSLVYDNPTSAQQAQFSMPFAVACIVVHGNIGVHHIDACVLADPELRDAMAKVEMTLSRELASDPTTLQHYPEAAIVTVTLRDGRKLRRFHGAATGLPSRPMSNDDLTRKFLACTHDLVPTDLARQWLERVNAIEKAGLGFRLLDGLDFDGH